MNYDGPGTYQHYKGGEYDSETFASEFAPLSRVDA